MSSLLQIKFSKIDVPKKGLVVVCAEHDLSFPEITSELDSAADGQIKKAASFSKFTGKKKTFLDVLAPANLDLGRIIVCGLGKRNSLEEDDWLNLGGAVRARVTGRDAPDATVVLEGVKGEQISPENAANFALGLLLRSYSFDKYKTKKGRENENDKDSDKELKRVTIQCSEPAKARAAYEKLKAVGEGIYLARDLVNEPANKLGPEEFSKKAKSLEKLDVDVEILNESQMKKLGMHALLGVGQGSAKPSFLVIMQWNGAKSKKSKPIAFVGKGVTFDTGGISIKPSAGMEDMKGDMGGAACVTGLMHALAGRKAKVNVVGVIGLTENMVSGDAQRPGDIVESMSGQTIEILNTDAEGRLVLADALWYTQDRFKPEFIVDLATLTGAILVALGKEYAGMFSNNDDLCEKLSKAGEATGEKVWRLPLGSKYDKMIDSKNADVKNLGGRHAGSTTAAQFLQRFVNDVPWAHLDVAGTAMASNQSDINRSWGSGYGVRLLNRLIEDNYED